MIRAHFLSPEDRADLIALARNGSAAHRLARRANALVLLDDGWSCENVARALLLDDDTIRGWHGLFVNDDAQSPSVVSIDAPTIHDLPNHGGLWIQNPKQNATVMLEAVRRDHTGLHSFLNMSLMEARRRNASALRLRFSQSLASRLHRPSHANVRSTTHRFGKTTKPLARSERLTISTFTCVIIFVTARRNTRP